MKKISSFVVCFILMIFSAQALAPFNINLHRGNSHDDVLRLQQYLNSSGFLLAESGPGSMGNETNYFGPLTQEAVRAFQEYYGVQILSPLSLIFGTGNFFSFTRNFINNQLLNIQPSLPTITTPTTTTSTNTTSTNTGTTPSITWNYVGGSGGGGGGRSITPTISFNDITMSYTTTPFQITATSDSPGNFVYGSSNAAIASVSGDMVTIHDIGSVTLTVTQSASGRYVSVSDTATLTITDIDGCAGSPCQNGGTCTHVAPGGYSCDCELGYSGATCTTFDGYSVGGTASGITDTVVLQNNGGNDIAISGNGAFTFSDVLTNLATYLVTIETEPASLACSLSNGSGTISGSNITNVSLACIARPTLGGFPDITNNTATGIPTYTLPTPTSNSAGAFTYSIVNGSIGSISGNLLTINGTGTTTLTATQAANGIYGVGTINATLTINVVNACVSAPCGSNGTCTRTRSVPGGLLDAYSCTCDSGYYGTNCQFVDSSPNACLDVPCENGGTCTRASSTLNGPLDSFTCSCAEGYSGVVCQESTINCGDTVICQNGGTCVASVGGGECACDTCYTGVSCETYDYDACPNE